MLDIRRREVTSTKKKLAKVVIGFASIILLVAVMLLLNSFPSWFQVGITRDTTFLLGLTTGELVISSIITMAASVCVIILAQRIK